MQSTGHRTGPQDIIEAERSAYLEQMPGAEADWPADVRVVYRELKNRLFEGGVEAQELVAKCGIGSNDVYSRFRHFTGLGIKEFLIYHRLQLANHLLRYQWLSVSQIAFAVGYRSPSGFSATFKRHRGESPTAFRSRKEEQNKSKEE